MPAYAELEITIARGSSGSYEIRLRYSDASSDADVLTPPGPVALDAAALRALEWDPAAYGQALSAALFGDPEIRAAFGQARTRAAAQDHPLRVRLFVDTGAADLQALPWERLAAPGTAAPLCTSEQVLFSRYLGSADWRPVRLRAQGTLRALVVIANPTDLDRARPGGRALPPIDVAGELARARESLGAIPVTALASGGAATLENLITQLREGIDILYLVAHGAVTAGEPRLWLESAAGTSDVVAGGELTARLADLQQRPRLVVLASCESAGSGPGGGEARVALGPQLATAGIPAVLAMQGDITMVTVAAFMPVFFRELGRDGQIDRAVAAARGAVRDRPDSWMPVLFLRLRSGRIWYVAGFTSAGEGPAFEKWPALLDNIYDERCTPILGSGLLESLIGTTHELAQRWAETYRFPLAASGREDLPQVAQYLAVNQQPSKPRREFANYVRLELLRRYGDRLPPELHTAGLEQVLAAVGVLLRKTDPTEPHKVLAGLPFPIYLSTNADNFLADALAEAGKQPRVDLCRWNQDLRWPPSVYARDPNYTPAKDQPLVYHLFGQIRLLDSLVLKEDDYFDYLIGVAGNRDVIPDDVRRALADTALLFLGFHLDDWDFRALFRSLMLSQEGRSRRTRYTHVAAQIDPEEGRNLDPEGARRYLQGYFQEAAISIYWGSVEDFVRELQARWAAYGQAQGGAP